MGLGVRGSRFGVQEEDPVVVSGTIGQTLKDYYLSLALLDSEGSRVV